MRHLTLVPAFTDGEPVEIMAFDYSAVFNVMRGMACREANIFEGDDYRFSLWVDREGVWCIFRREEPVPRNAAAGPAPRRPSAPARSTVAR